ncbi:hypothetical protein V6617_10260 [Pelagibacterium nitratireducens]|uniref:Uncharacterized protein n=1 Tax=Pelagibacterium nitratireducens TaxID=1046114 RepID=A0ABZ2I0K5_9HYPH
MLHTQQAGPVQPIPKPSLPVAERIAAIMIDLQAEGAATEKRILERMAQEGLTEFDLAMYGAQAGGIANERFMRREDHSAAKRANRIKEAARLIGHLVPSTQEICAALQSRSFTKPELEDILPEAIASAADAFAHAGGAQ